MKILQGQYLAYLVDGCIRVRGLEDALSIERTPQNRKLVFKDHTPFKVIKRHSTGRGRMIVPLKQINANKV